MKLLLIRPSDHFSHTDELRDCAGHSIPLDRLPLFNVAALPVIVGDNGLPVKDVNGFLAHMAVRSRGATGDTARTYAEAVLSWLKFAQAQRFSLGNATEELLAQYRNEMVGACTPDGKPKYSRSTVNNRVTIAGRLHLWGKRKGRLLSPLGEFLEKQRLEMGPRSYGQHRHRSENSMHLGTSERLPRVLSPEELSRLFVVTPPQYVLMFRWAVATGLRRFEVCGLRRSGLSSPEQIAARNMELVPIEIVRKGGKTATVHAPSALVEQTWWYIHFQRPRPEKQRFEDVVFLNRYGSPFARQTLSKVFRSCANQIGSDATLHHMRHTFAVSVLAILEASSNKGRPMNSLKAVQTLLGHANVTTTEIYLRALEMSSDEVRESLDFLYGATL